MASQPVACSRCTRPTTFPNDDGVCPACLDRDARRLVADRRAEFSDAQLNWLTVRLRGRDNGRWATFVELHKCGDPRPCVGMSTECDERDEAVRRFRELVDQAFRAGWRPVDGRGDRRCVDPSRVAYGHLLGVAEAV